MSQNDPKIDFNQARERFDREACFQTGIPAVTRLGPGHGTGARPPFHSRDVRSQRFLCAGRFGACKDFRCIGYDLPGIQPGTRPGCSPTGMITWWEMPGKFWMPLGPRRRPWLAPRLARPSPKNCWRPIHKGLWRAFCKVALPIARLVGKLSVAWGRAFCLAKPLIRFQGYPGILKKVHWHGFEIR